MIEALISGKLMGTPSQRTGRNGNPFTVANVRVPTGDGAVFCHVIAFSDSARLALLALADGDAVALAGSLKVGTWQAKDGTHHPSLDMTASQVLTVYHAARKRKAMQPEREGGGTGAQQRGKHSPHAEDLDDGGPLDF